VQERVETIDGLGRLRLGAVLALAAAGVFVAWFLLSNRKDEAATPTKTVVAASASDLKALPRSVGHPVYWASTKRGFTYELTQTPQGNVYIRYLPPDVQLNDKRPDFLTVGTYPYPNAFGITRNQAKRRGAFRRPIAGGGIAYSSAAKPTSVYFAYPGLDYLYEVYDPAPRRARSLLLSGRVRPIG
jgi:hypothetical protein